MGLTHTTPPFFYKCGERKGEIRFITTWHVKSIPTMDYITAAVLSIAIIAGSILGKSWVASRTNEMSKVKYKELLDLEKLSSDKWRKLYQSAKGKYSQMLAGPTLDESADPKDFAKSIPQLIQNAKGLPLPPFLKNIINIPGVDKYLVQLAEQYPEQAQQFIGAFIQSPSTETGQSESKQQPELLSELA